MPFGIGPYGRGPAGMQVLQRIGNVEDDIAAMRDRLCLPSYRLPQVWTLQKGKSQRVDLTGQVTNQLVVQCTLGTCLLWFGDFTAQNAVGGPPPHLVFTSANPAIVIPLPPSQEYIITIQADEGGPANITLIPMAV